MPNYSEIAAKAAAAARRYAPAVVDKAKSTLAQVTNNKVSDLNGLRSYVGDSPERLKVVSEALLHSGVMLGDVLPRDVIGTDVALVQIRNSAEKLIVNMRAQYEGSRDHTMDLTDDQIAADVIRKQRVRAALQIFGSETNYFILNPKNGAISANDFVWYNTLFRA